MQLKRHRAASGEYLGNGGRDENETVHDAACNDTNKRMALCEPRPGQAGNDHAASNIDYGVAEDLVGIGLRSRGASGLGGFRRAMSEIQM